jgi:hypothetical protein
MIDWLRLAESQRCECVVVSGIAHGEGRSCGFLG